MTSHARHAWRRASRAIVLATVAAGVVVATSIEVTGWTDDDTRVATDGAVAVGSNLDLARAPSRTDGATSGAKVRKTGPPPRRAPPLKPGKPTAPGAPRPAQPPGDGGPYGAPPSQAPATVSGTTSRNSRRTSRRLPVAPDVALRLVLLGVLAGLYWHWRRTTSSLLGPDRDGGAPSAGARWHATPVRLTPPPAVDPATVGIEDVFDRKARADVGVIPPSAAPSPVAPPIPIPAAEEDSDAIAARDLDAISAIRIASRLAHPGGQTVDLGPPPILPSALARHFEGLPGEHLQWTGAVRLPGFIQGMLGVTDERVLVVYERRLPLAWPPMTREIRRHQIPIERIGGCGVRPARQPFLLAVAAFLTPIWPIGSAGALLAVLAYFVWKRDELQLKAGHMTRQYPMAPEDMAEAKAALATVLMEKRRQGRNRKAAG